MKKQKGIKQLNADMENKNITKHNNTDNITTRRYTPNNIYNKKLNLTPVATERLAGKMSNVPRNYPLINTRLMPLKLLLLLHYINLLTLLT